MSRAPILIQPGKNRDEGGGKLDLYGYLVNELNAHRIKANLRECSGPKGALKLLREARRQLKRAKCWVPGSLDMAITEIALSKGRRH